jgi:hypothetical protein
MKHQLSLEIPDTNNTQIFRLFDTSTYATDLKTTCGMIQITAPGFTVPVQIETLPYFNLVLNACTLGIYQGGCSEYMPDLPDGIYKVAYSVSPNDQVFVEYQYLRITHLLNEYFEQLCKLEIAGCEPTAEVKAKLRELRFIRSLLDAAKVKVEYCNAPTQGIEMFQYAQKRLHKFSGGCKTC